MRERASHSTSSPLNVLGWAAYLACSWTWCIGMFLPVLLVRDYGPWGFLVFAVPNVLGAAGMGWVLRRPGASERVLIRNLPACAMFSRVTSAFQWFFMGWMLARFGPGGGCIGLGFLAILILSLRAGRPTLVHAISIVVLGLSGFFALVLAQRGALSLPREVGHPPPDLIWLAPVCALGFGLCPYLDMTFHRARRMCPGPAGTAAFTLGFGVFFALLIVFTLAYRGLMTGVEPLRTVADLATNPAAILCAYLFMQLAFTVAVHGIETDGLAQAMAERRGRARSPRFVAISTAAFLACPLALGLAGALWGPIFRGLAFNEVVYRCFLSFYGLFFPAYVWLCMIPTPDGHSGITRDKIRAWAAAVGIAAPMFWMGFIERQTWWLAPGLAVVLCTRLALPRGKDPATSARPARRTA